jgi:xanthine/uracil permease
MKPSDYLYDLDDHPPIQYALVYGLQWAFIMFPALIIASSLGSGSLDMGTREQIRFLQFTLLTSGLFTIVQTLWGHRYPLLEGPSTALVLTFILLAPYGLPVVQGGLILGGALLILIVFSRRLEIVVRFFTPNVIGVILMLIAFGLLPPLLGFMAGTDASHPGGRLDTFLISLCLVLLIATLSYRLRGFWKSVSILIGMIVGSLVFLSLGRLHWQGMAAASWVSLSNRWFVSSPKFYWPAAVAFAWAYLAVMVNSLGSLEGIASITTADRLPSAIRRGIFFNGLGGIACGFFGVVGTVSYSSSPGVILVNRVASRYAVTYCGALLFLAAFLPKLAALLSLVPTPVVGAALCVAMGGQIGVGMALVTSQGLTSRDYFVVGLPVLLGTMAGFLPRGLFETMPASFRVFLGNSLIVGIFMVLLLEHLLLRQKGSKEAAPPEP